MTFHTIRRKFPVLLAPGLIALAAGSAGGAEPAFLAPPRLVAPPDEDHATSTRAFQGIPSLAVAHNGRLWATWYAGPTPGEDHNNYVVLATSGDGGGTWTEALIVDPDGPGPVRAFDPEMWMAPDGRIHAFWAQDIRQKGTLAGVWCMTADRPGEASPKWSEPRRLTDGVMMCKPLVLSSGEWILPASAWHKTEDSARVVASNDRGRTWSIRGACHVPEDDRNHDEHMVVERQDGSLWMLVRTNYGIGESVSRDGGRTWSDLERSPLGHPPARFFIRRLESGNLLLVKHGAVGESIGRSHLTAFLSRDDGASWEGGLLLDEREGISYPDGQQGPDGVIHIVYDYSRTGAREILLARFREEDVLEGDRKAPGVTLRSVVSRAGGAD